MLDLYAELRRVVEVLDTGGIPYALAGGLAVSIYTSPRATEDVDLLIAGTDVSPVPSSAVAIAPRPRRP